MRSRFVGQAQKPFVDLLEAHAKELQPIETQDAAAQLFGPLLHRRLISGDPIEPAFIACFVAGNRPDAANPEPPDTPKPDDAAGS